MKYDVLYNFISPVTGRVLSDQNYVLYGNRLGIALPSPIIIDIRLDLINLRKDFSELKKDYKFSSDATFVLNTPNVKLPNAQALNQLTGSIPRILKANTNGIIEVAVTNTDYATVTKLEELRDAAAGSASAAATSAATASIKAAQALESANSAKDSATKAESSASSAVASATKATKILKEVTILAAAAGGAFTGAALAASLAEKAAHDAEVAAYKIKQTGMRIITNQNAGVPGAAGAAGIPTLLIDSNIDLNGARLENISSSPVGDNDAVSAKWVWDLLNDNVEIIWQ